MNKLYKYLPYYEKSSKVFQEITRVESEEFDKLYLCIEDINKQIFLDTATWALSIYEKELKILINIDKSLDERRNIIKSKLKGSRKIDYLVIKEIVEIFTKIKVNIEFDGLINIIFLDNTRLDISNEEMYCYIDEVKPAHLDYKFEKRKEDTIKILSILKKGFNKFPLCNVTICGTYPYKINKHLIHNVKQMIVQQIKINTICFNLCGKTIVKKGKNNE